MIVTSEKLSNSNCKIFVLQSRKTIPDFIFGGKIMVIVVCLPNKVKNKIYHTVGTVPKSNRKITEKDTIDNPNTQIHDLS
jgi:hypothetical protein